MSDSGMKALGLVALISLLLIPQSLIGADFKTSLQKAEQGDAVAQFEVGLMYAKGDKTKKDFVQAYNWFRKAAEQGNAKAQHNLGVMYFNGDGVVKDELEALAWFYVAKANGIDCGSTINAAESRNGKTFALIAQQRAKKLQTATNKAPEKSPELYPTIKATGTGVFISADGLILTAAHVIDNASKIKAATKEGIVTVRLVTLDRNNDVALLKAECTGHPVPIKSSKSVKLGQRVFTLGFPNPDLQGRNLKMTDGSISSLGGLLDDPRQWQISVPVQPGNSGGPLFDEQGNLIGIVVAKLNAINATKFTGDLPQNVNYAVKSSYFLPLLEQHEAGLLPEVVPGAPAATDSVVEKVQDSVVFIQTY